MASPSLPRWLPFAALTALAAAGAGFVWLLVAAAPPAAPVVGEAAEVLRVARPLPDFALRDQHGRPFDRARLTGHWSFVFFGYTFCPDVCPNTLGTLARVHALLDDAGTGADVQFVFVSVDPQRDTPERLAAYLPYFDDSFLGATGDAGEIERLTGTLGVVHRRGEDAGARAGAAADGDYLVDHTAAVLLVDPQARLVARIDHPEDPEAMAAAFGRLRTLPGATP
jgi:protein SCO1/2